MFVFTNYKTKIMNQRLLLLFVISIFSFSIVNAQDANSLLWKVTKKSGDEPSYLYGTIHIQDARVFAFSEDVYTMLKSCDVLAVELVMDEIDQTVLMESFTVKEGAIKDYMTEEQYHTLDSIFTERIGQGFAMYQKMNPFFFTSMFAQLDLPQDMPMALL